MFISQKLKYTSLLLTVSCVVLSLTFVQCKKKKDDEETVFRKEDIMRNLADNYIEPGYNSHKAAVLSLETSWNTFLSDMSLANLSDVQNKWKAGAVTFQRIRMFDFGPAMSNNLVFSQGVFPADTVQMEANISAGSYDLNSMNNDDAIGFDALDYLLFQVDAYNKLSSDAVRRQYVSDLIQLIKSQIVTVVNAWPAYETGFISSTGTEITSSFSALVNSFSKDFEIVKSAKVGIPIGTTTLGINKPAYLEARRSKYGKELLLANIGALQKVYLGNSYSSNAVGIGFDDYLLALERTELNTAISGSFNSLVSSPDSWNGTMEQLLNTNESVLQQYYNLIYGTVPYIKADMASAFSVVITYQDNDGD